jgi:hypothetical protein
MDITDGKSANQWLASWHGRVPHGYLASAIEGQRASASLCGTRLPVTKRGHVAALDVLEAAMRRRFPDRN